MPFLKKWGISSQRKADLCAFQLISTSHLLFPLPLLLLKLQPQGELLQRRAVQRVLRILKLDNLVKYGPQLVQKGLDREIKAGTSPVSQKRKRGGMKWSRKRCVTLLLLSSRHLEMIVSRKTSWAAMMWSRSWACCTLFHSSSHEHSSTYTHTPFIGVKLDTHKMTTMHNSCFPNCF